MKCPVCDVALKLAEREQIEVSYCPRCLGAWLECGQLDKIVACLMSNGGRHRGNASLMASVPSEPRNMAVQCAWCRKNLGIKAGDGISHGICPTCAAKVLAELPPTTPHLVNS